MSAAIAGGSGLSSGSIITLENGELIFGVGMDDSSGGQDIFTAGSGFTKRVDFGVDGGYADQDEVQTLAGSVAATMTTSISGQLWITDMAAFKPTITATGGGAPVITSLSPTIGAVGNTVTISGTGFGTSQSASTVTFNGTAATPCPTCWSANSITVPVPSSATTGNVVVTVGGLPSNGVSFTVAVPPSITASASPAPNAAGWNNSNVTVTFTCTPGSAPITSCPSPQTVTSEGSGQVISGTATDANGLTATASVTLKIDKSVPQLAAIAPPDGSSVSSSPVTVTGTLSDALSGASAVTCNGANASLSAGNFSCNISLNVGVNLVAVRGTDVAGNIAGANVHLTLAGTLPAPQSLQVSPVMVNMLVGDTQQFTVVDQLGRPRTDATWTIDNASVATLSTDPTTPSLVTAVAVGTATLTATVGSVSAQATIHVLSGTSLAPGTVRWTAPSTPGFTVQQIVQAVPTNNGPDLYSIETDGNNTPLVRALTADGQQMWLDQLSLSQYNYGLVGTPNAAMPDNQGGILVKLLTNPGSFPQNLQTVDLDAQTGSQIWAFGPFVSDVTPLTGQAAVRQDGTIFKLNTYQGQPALLGIDPNTGATVFVYPIPTGTATGTTCPNSKVPTVSTLSPPTVGADGTVYSIFRTTDLALAGCFPPFANGEATLSTLTQTLKLLQIATDGTTSLTQLRQDVSAQTPTGTQFQGQVQVLVVPSPPFNHSALVVDYFQAIPQAQGFHVIPDGQGGVLAPYAFANVQSFVALPAYHQRVTHFASGTVQADFQLALQPTSNPTDFPMVLGENGNFFATDGTLVVAVGASSSSVQWTYQPAQGVSSVLAAEGGPILVTNAQSNQIPLDASGNAGSGTNCIGAFTPLALGRWAAASSGTLTVTICSNFEPASSEWFAAAGDLGGQNASHKLNVATFIARAPSSNANDPTFGTIAATAGYLKKNILTTAATGTKYIDSGKYVASTQSFDGANGPNVKAPIDVLGFIGDSVIINGNPSFSAGLIFLDAYILRTPNCNVPGLCYDQDSNNPVAPCPAFDTQIDFLCYQIPALDPQDGHGFREGRLRDVILTSAKVVFIASCDTTDVFTGWWDLKLNLTPGGRALVVPDIAAMAALPSNQANVQPQNLGSVDLILGTVAYQAFVNSLATGHTADQAKDAANKAVADLYCTCNYPADKILPQVIYKVVGSTVVCPTGKCGT